MSNSISYLLGMLIAILGGTFFFVSYCSQCRALDKARPQESAETVWDHGQKIDFRISPIAPLRADSVPGAEIPKPRVNAGSSPLVIRQDSEALPDPETKPSGP